jgi:hypothetical protein
MKTNHFLASLLVLSAGVLAAQTKKDGTPDMRYKANKEMYGSPTISTPDYFDTKPDRNYDNGGQLKLQDGYYRSNGTYVEPHIKTTPDNYKWNNVQSWDPK